MNGIGVAEFLKNAHDMDDIARMTAWRELDADGRAYINLQIGLDNAKMLDEGLTLIRADVAAIREAQQGPWLQVGKSLGVFTGGIMAAIVAFWKSQ